MEEISFAVIDLNSRKPLLGGINMEHFIYPASVYKMYVAMEILKQVSEEKYSLYKLYVIKLPNDVGIVGDGQVKYIIVLFTPVTEMDVRPRMKELSRRVYELMKRRSGK